MMTIDRDICISREDLSIVELTQFYSASLLHKTSSVEWKTQLDPFLLSDLSIGMCVRGFTRRPVTTSEKRLRRRCPRANFAQTTDNGVDGETGCLGDVQVEKEHEETTDCGHREEDSTAD